MLGQVSLHHFVEAGWCAPAAFDRPPNNHLLHANNQRTTTFLIESTPSVISNCRVRRTRTPSNNCGVVSACHPGIGWAEGSSTTPQRKHRKRCLRPVRTPALRKRYRVTHPMIPACILDSESVSLHARLSDARRLSSACISFAGHTHGPRSRPGP